MGNENSCCFKEEAKRKSNSVNRVGSKPKEIFKKSQLKELKPPLPKAKSRSQNWSSSILGRSNESTGSSSAVKFSSKQRNSLMNHAFRRFERIESVSHKKVSMSNKSTQASSPNVSVEAETPPKAKKQVCSVSCQTDDSLLLGYLSEQIGKYQAMFSSMQAVSTIKQQNGGLKPRKNSKQSDSALKPKNKNSSVMSIASSYNTQTMSRNKVSLSLNPDSVDRKGSKSQILSPISSTYKNQILLGVGAVDNQKGLIKRKSAFVKTNTRKSSPNAKKSSDRNSEKKHQKETKKIMKELKKSDFVAISSSAQKIPLKSSKNLEIQSIKKNQNFQNSMSKKHIELHNERASRRSFGFPPSMNRQRITCSQQHIFINRNGFLGVNNHFNRTNNPRARRISNEGLKTSFNTENVNKRSPGSILNSGNSNSFNTPFQPHLANNRFSRPVNNLNMTLQADRTPPARDYLHRYYSNKRNLNVSKKSIPAFWRKMSPLSGVWGALLSLLAGLLARKSPES